MGYGPRQWVRDRAWAMLKYLVCVCKNKNMMGKLLFVQKRKKTVRRESVMVITLRWSRQSGCRVQSDVRPGNQMIRCLSEGIYSLFPSSQFSVVSSCFFLCYHKPLPVCDGLQTLSIFFLVIKPWYNTPWGQKSTRHNSVPGIGECK